MIKVYTDKHIIKEFPKLYTFLSEKKIVSEFLLGLNTIHGRRYQSSWWNNNKVNKQFAISMFSWGDYYDKYGFDIDWEILFEEFESNYNNIKPYKKIDLIKVV